MADNAVPPDQRGIVPPFLDPRWARLRARLDAAAVLSADASSKSTTEDAKALIGEALAALMDASFWCAFIERDLCNEPLAWKEDQ